jgi:hypothetical protein
MLRHFVAIEPILRFAENSPKVCDMPQYCGICPDWRGASPCKKVSGLSGIEIPDTKILLISTPDAKHAMLYAFNYRGAR